MPGATSTRSRGLAAALLALLSAGAARAELYTVPSDESLILTADHCVVGALTDDLSLRVKERVFGGAIADTVAVEWDVLDSRERKPGTDLVAFLKQDGLELSCPPCGVRHIAGGRVATSEQLRMSREFYRIELNAARFPTEVGAYVREVRSRAREAALARREAQTAALDRLSTPGKYLEKDGAVPLGLLDGVLWTVHADDSETLTRMARFVRERPASRYSHARGSFVQVLARKNFVDGLDAVRLEASRLSGDGGNWASERDATNALAMVGGAEDVELLKGLVIRQHAARHGRALLRDSFPALGRLADRVYGYESTERESLRRWLERYCADPSEVERDRGSHVYAAVPLGILGRKASLPLLKKLHLASPHPYYAEAIARIEDRVGRAEPAAGPSRSTDAPSEGGGEGEANE